MVKIDSAVHREAKLVGVQRGVTLSAIVTEAVRDWLRRLRRRREPERKV